MSASLGLGGSDRTTKGLLLQKSLRLAPPQHLLGAVHLRSYLMTSLLPCCCWTLEVQKVIESHDNNVAFTLLMLTMLLHREMT